MGVGFWGWPLIRPVKPKGLLLHGLTLCPPSLPSSPVHEDKSHGSVHQQVTSEAQFTLPTIKVSLFHSRKIKFTTWDRLFDRSHEISTKCLFCFFPTILLKILTSCFVIPLGLFLVVSPVASSLSFLTFPPLIRQHLLFDQVSFHLHFSGSKFNMSTH